MAAQLQTFERGELKPARQRERASTFGWVLLGALLAGGAAQAQSTPDSSGPQTAVPAPAPGGTADVPGGSARNGVITPPPTGGTMPVVPPPVPGRTPVIRPPDTTTGPQPVQPK